MGDLFLGEAELREMLEQALVSEPPLGPVVRGAMRAGVRRRWRRRVAGVVAGFVLAAVAAVSVPTLTARPAAVPVMSPPRAAVFVATLDGPRALVTRISTVKGSNPGRPAGAGPWVDMLAVAPDGKTVYAVDQESDEVVPISVTTGAARRPIKVAGIPFAIVVTPDGKTAFVLGEKSTLTPITLATGRIGKPIAIPPAPASSGLAAMPVMSRDGRTVYVTPTSLKGHVLIPVDVATERAGTPIRLSFRPDVVVLSPDGKTLYLVNTVAGTVTPLPVATRVPRRPIKVGRGPVAMAFTPDGRTAYVVNRDSGTVTPIDADAGRALPSIRVGSRPLAIAITPDGKTAYVVNNGSGTVTAIDIATRRAWPAISIPGIPDGVAIAPDGRMAYVTSTSPGSGSAGQVGEVTPIYTQDRTAVGRAVAVTGEPVAIVIAP